MKDRVWTRTKEGRKDGGSWRGRIEKGSHDFHHAGRLLFPTRANRVGIRRPDHGFRIPHANFHDVWRKFRGKPRRGIEGKNESSRMREAFSLKEGVVSTRGEDGLLELKKRNEEFFRTTFTPLSRRIKEARKNHRIVIESYPVESVERLKSTDFNILRGSLESNRSTRRNISSWLTLETRNEQT